MPDWEQKVREAFSLAQGVNLKIWKSGYPKRSAIEPDAIMFIYADFSWQGAKMLELLSSLCSRCSKNGEDYKLTMHILNPMSLEPADYVEIQQSYGPLEGSGGRGECYFVRKGEVRVTWSGLGLTGDAVNELNRLSDLFKGTYIDNIDEI